MSNGLVSPYTAPDFYASALSKGRHRDIVGGRWDETGRAQMQILLEAGLAPRHHLLDIGAGALRLGCKAVPYLDAGHYWATDASRALMLAGHAQELSDPARLSPDHLVEDADFAFPAIPDSITHAIAFAVFTHLPMNHLRLALVSLRQRFPRLETLLFTVFLCPDAARLHLPCKQPDGVVTHATRAPWHMLAEDVLHLARASGFAADLRTDRLPRGQALVVARPA
ncbi:class I SAM-dependent methyltransferase [Paragemmobacter straminiformis]|uniref:Class I SAM-dependent methyltransferase n=1 Tax=Paragemmobacter straminiformis TaxID=2045119 RepID=A0A842IDY1_9RHOB|nr:class I SAM-dependent methyltransferase [Gemmobacter straminiformis]MBC2837078.1 class I SAM-dependent methyltransferase [Gemmobacter straminiformis]